MLASKQKKKNKQNFIGVFLHRWQTHEYKGINHDWATMTQVFHDILLNLYQKPMYMDT